MILDSTDANTLRSAYEDLRHGPACECSELESRASQHMRAAEVNRRKTGFANAIRKRSGAALRCLLIISIVHRLCSAYTNSRSPGGANVADRALRNGGWGGGGGWSARLWKHLFPSSHHANPGHNRCPVEYSYGPAMYLPSSNFLFSYLSPFDKN